MTHVQRILTLAGEILQRGHWCQGWYSYATSLEGHRVRCEPDSERADCFCVHGAVWAAAHRLGVASSSQNADPQGLVAKALDRVRKTLANVTDSPAIVVPVWNDRKGRTKGEAIALLKVAAHDDAVEERPVRRAKCLAASTG
jgi:hypothetical protein